MGPLQAADFMGAYWRISGRRLTQWRSFPQAFII